jgi:hypothetical protein
MEVVISNNIPDKFKYQTLGVIGDLNDLLDMDFDIEGIIYDDSWTVKRFLNGLHLKLNNRIESFFLMLELDKKLLNKRINTISKTDLKFVLLIYAMLKNYKTIIFDHMDANMSYKDKKRLLNFIRKIKNDDLNFIFLSKDLEFLYKITNHLIIIKDNKIIYDDLIDDAYTLEELDFKIINFIKLANKKGANLIYTFDRKELLKDIYRSVM